LWPIRAIDRWPESGKRRGGAFVQDRAIDRSNLKEIIVMNARLVAIAATICGAVALFAGPASAQTPPGATVPSRPVVSDVRVLARFDLATGQADAPLDDPPGAILIPGLGTDPSGQFLIASTIGRQSGPRTSSGPSAPVWTEHDGNWTQVPGINAPGVTW